MSKVYLIVIVCLGLQGCLAGKTVTVWKPEVVTPLSYNKMMIAVIMEKGDDSARLGFETYIAEQFSALGYYSISIMSEYGDKGLRNLDAESSYLALCESGIDAVLVLAMIDKTLADKNRSGVKYNSEYYYKRIWSYRSLLERSNSAVSASKTERRWESILFDLNSLQPKSVIQVKSTHRNAEAINLQTVADQIINAMRRSKIIVKRQAGYKPF